MKEIVFIGSGVRYLDEDVVTHYTSGNRIIIGKAYRYGDYDNQIAHDYYFWTGNTFKKHIIAEKRRLVPPKIKSILVSCSQEQQRELVRLYGAEIQRLKCEFYTKSMWKFYCGQRCSMGIRTFFYIIDTFPDIERIVFLGCSVLAGEYDGIKDAHKFNHDFKKESSSIKQVMDEMCIEAEWIHKSGVF